MHSWEKSKRKLDLGYVEFEILAEGLREHA